MKSIFFLTGIALLALAMPIAHAEPIPVVGLDKNHEPQSMNMPEGDFSQLYSSLIAKVNAPTLETLQARDRATLPSATYWMLRDVCVGLGLNFSLGLGQIWSVSAAPRLRLGFSNSTHPKIPD